MVIIRLCNITSSAPDLKTFKVAQTNVGNARIFKVTVNPADFPVVFLFFLHIYNVDICHEIQPDRYN